MCVQSEAPTDRPFLSVRGVQAVTIYVQANDGLYCIASHKTTDAYQDNIRVRCGHWIVLSWDITSETPPETALCSACAAKLEE